MPAPDYDTIYDFDGALYPALADIYTATGLPVWYQRMTQVPTKPYLAMKLLIGSAVGSPPHLGRHTDGVYVEDMWGANLETEIHSDRSRNFESGLLSGVDSHRLYVVKVRYSMARWRTLLVAANLPYHAIGSIESTGDSPRIEAEDNEDITSLTHRIVFGIRPDAWPV